jgi:hypothetical protein
MQNISVERKRTLPLWALLLSLAVISFAFVFIPAWLIQPFKSQNPGDLSISYALKQWAPTLTAIAFLYAMALSWMIWKRTRRWWVRLALILPFVPLALSLWFARQNHFEWMFKPLPDARFVSVRDANFIADNEMVLAIEINGDAVAFPIRQIAYHHVVNDVVGGKPITATY